MENASDTAMSVGQVVLDLETKKTFDEVGGRNFVDLGVTVVGTYSYETNRYKAFEEKELSELEQMLSQASRIIGFNTHRFDFLVLQPHFKRLKLSDLPSLDLLESLEGVLGHRVSLQTLASATLNSSKSGSGLDAIEYYRRGEIDKLKQYCLDDVRLTMEIYEFGKKNRFVNYFARDGKTKREAAIDWSDPKPPDNLSLF